MSMQHCVGVQFKTIQISNHNSLRWLLEGRHECLVASPYHAEGTEKFSWNVITAFFNSKQTKNVELNTWHKTRALGKN